LVVVTLLIRMFCVTDAHARRVPGLEAAYEAGMNDVEEPRQP
jgi:hypothetical protein